MQQNLDAGDNMVSYFEIYFAVDDVEFMQPIDTNITPFKNSKEAVNIIMQDMKEIFVDSNVEYLYSKEYKIPSEPKIKWYVFTNSNYQQ